MRLEDFLFEGSIQDMAREFVRFQNYIEQVIDEKAKNPAKAKDRIRKAFQSLEKQIKKAIKE